MNYSRWHLGTLAVLLMIAACVGGSVQERGAIAQEKLPADNTSRYQISAYGTGGNLHGCYIVDTATGTLWQSSNGGLPKKITDKLP